MGIYIHTCTVLLQKELKGRGGGDCQNYTTRYLYIYSSPLVGLGYCPLSVYFLDSSCHQLRGVGVLCGRTAGDVG